MVGNATDAPSTNPGIHQAEIVIYVIVLAIEATCSVLGSSLVCVTFIGVRNLSSKPTSKLIVSLAVSDAAMGALVLPFTASTVANQAWVYGHAACQFQGLLKTFLSQVQRSTLLLIAVDRLLRVKYRCRFGAERPRLMVWPVLATWVLNVPLAVPPLLGWGVFEWSPSKPSCTVDWLFSVSYSVTFLTVFGIVLQFLITACYVLIFMEVRASRIRVRTAVLSIRLPEPSSASTTNPSPALNRRHPPPANPFMSRDEVAVARTMIILVALSTVLSLPYFISQIISLMMDSHLSYRNEIIITLMVYLNSCLNPIIYGATNSRFRRGFRTVVRCSCRRNH